MRDEGYPVHVIQGVENKVPARVRFAADALGFFAHKTQTTVAMNSVSIYEVEPQKLTKEELDAQAAAATLLHDYFKGNLEFDEFEKIRSNSLQSSSQDTTLIICPACRGERKIQVEHPEGLLIKACGLCHERGDVRVIDE